MSDTGWETKYEAPKGQVWVCGACGKLSTNRAVSYGSGWDESCFINAVLCYADSVESDGARVVKAKAVAGAEPPNE